MFISKKELLQQTKISYGQLYRWKREGLIPESWFIKKASFTGQETVFPRDKILQRVEAIQSMKQKYSLEELARILSPEVTQRNFTRDDLARFDEIGDEIIHCIEQVWRKDSYRYIELLIILAINQCRDAFDLNKDHIKNICKGIQNHLSDVKHTDYFFILLRLDHDYFASLNSEQSQVFLDQRLEAVKIIPLNDLSATIKVKYRNRFNLKFESDEHNAQNPNIEKAVMA